MILLLFYKVFIERSVERLSQERRTHRAGFFSFIEVGIKRWLSTALFIVGGIKRSSRSTPRSFGEGRKLLRKRTQRGLVQYTQSIRCFRSSVRRVALNFLYHLLFLINYAPLGGGLNMLHFADLSMNRELGGASVNGVAGRGEK